jgi:tetratricopeptide (TPR) repeat protein
MSRVFISYRRADSARWAAELNRRIGLRFGKDMVFQDVDDIRPGDDFEAALRRELADCEVYLLLIGPQWVVDAAGRRRLDDAADVLRYEVAHALAGSGTVLPVLVGGAAMPEARDLPEPIQALQRLGRRDEAAAALDRGEAVFETMLAELPDDASALNGLGSVEAVRGNLELAHEYVDRALGIAPDYPAALEDHRTLLQELGLRHCARMDAARRRRH